MEGKCEEADVDVAESILPKMVGSSRPKEAADWFSNLPLMAWYQTDEKTLKHLITC